MDFLSGKKTYITAILMIAMGVLEMVGIDVPNLAATDAPQLVMTGLGFFFMRQGIAKI